MLNRSLKLFIKIAEYGSITKVAKAFYITQPAVSNALWKLEDELGVKLFFRDKRSGLILTDVGKQILTYAKQMEDIDNRICQSAYKEKNMMGGRVRIAVLTSLVATILSKALKEYRSLYPEIEIEIKSIMDEINSPILSIPGINYRMGAMIIAEIGDWQRLVSSPSKEVSIMGYRDVSLLNTMRAFFSAYRLTLLKSTTGPVNHNPSGMITFPPPLELTALIALFIASVFKVTPSLSAPKSRILTS